MSPQTRNMHVLMTTATVSDVWAYSITLCSALAAHDVKVTLVSTGPKPTAMQAEAASRLDNVNFVPTEGRLEWMPDCEVDLAMSGERLLRLAEAVKPDLVHSNDFFHGSLPFDVPVLVVAHSCVASRWLACHGAPLPKAWSAYAERVARSLCRSDILVAPTEAFLEEFEVAHGPVPAAKVIWNGCNTPQYVATQKQRFVLAYGRLGDKAKNLEMLCRAPGGLDIPVCIAGARSTRSVDIDGRGAIDLGHLVGEALTGWMARASIFASPAHYEPFGASILEAALCGCALVLSDIPTHRELWDGAAQFVDPDNEIAWHRSLERLANDPALCTRLGGLAVTRARRYSAERMAASYLAAYMSLVHEGSGAQNRAA